MPLQAEMSPIAGSIPTAPTAQASLQIRLLDAGQSGGYSISVTDPSGAPVSDVAVAIRLPEDAASGFFPGGVRSAVAYTDVSGVAHFSQINWGATAGNVAARVTAAKGDLHAGALLNLTVASGQARVVVPPAAAPAPGTPATVASVHSGASTETPAARPAETAASPAPVVSIVNTAGNKGSSHGSNKKWILLAVIAVGAGAGAAMALAGHGSGAAASSASTGISVGAPTISLGH